LKLRRQFVVILCVFAFLLNDPQLIHACGIKERVVFPACQMAGSTRADVSVWGVNEIHISYALNGGTNSEQNPYVVHTSSLPFKLAVPVREGYNFAGWYTDSSYTDKITEINADNAADMILYAKWTRVIDSNYNVEMYSYQSASQIGTNLKELKDCSYSFLDNVVIPGMPATRENDYLGNLISGTDQCLQGLCFTPEYILITAYEEDSSLSGSLLVFDRESGKYLVTIGMKKKSHLGGIAFDGENIWICHSNGDTLERIPYEYICGIAENEPGCYVDGTGLSNEYKIKNSPSCITCYGGRIWVATHTVFFNSQMISYSYDTENDTLTALSSYVIPSKVQGVAFGEDGSVFLSTSYGRNNSSYLKVYTSLLTMTKNPDQPDVKVEMPPCSEEIAIADSNVYVLFESASARYFEGTDGNGTSSSPIDKVLQVEVASIW
jgi:uncharacterized repeat protein (TIGR02543 family)